nr:MAG TPA: hypothetical protein [Caudoviricetes sp.]
MLLSPLSTQIHCYEIQPEQNPDCIFLFYLF